MVDDGVQEDRIETVPFSDALTRRYLAYAMSTITSRSLPDVRDGLKPVHRRLLYAMHLLRLNPQDGFKKSARVVGDVIGKFHPHGDQAIYDALVRLAQDFVARYPLVDGQGNFGNVDGDNAAAMRYTEARMTNVALALLEGLDDDVVDFRPTYDGSEHEPVVLAARFPNLLANGTSGIAVGMATSIPPHNADELCQALMRLVDKPRTTTSELVYLVQGPDFPTGGELVESTESLVESYETGRGSFRLRARWHQEQTGRGTYRIVVDEIPYQVQKSRLVERIAGLLDLRRLPLLESVNDESAEDVRLVLVPKNRTVDPVVLMESLFRTTDLEVRIPLNLNVLDADGVPRVMNLRTALQAFIDHRQVILLRRSRNRIARIDSRLEVLEGFRVAYLNIDEVIRIIRFEDRPKRQLMERYALSELQAEAILNMRLRALHKLEEIKIEEEASELMREREQLDDLISSVRRQKTALKKEFSEIRAEFGHGHAAGLRRTRVGGELPAVDIPSDATMEREPITVILSLRGWIGAARQHGEQAGTLRFKEGDRERFRVEAWTTDKLLLFATNGRFYILGCDKLPDARGSGDPVRLLVDLGNDVDIVAMNVFRGDRKLIVASTDGRGFIVPEAMVESRTRSGKAILNVSGAVEAAAMRFVEGTHVAVMGGEERRLLICPLTEIPELNRGRGVILQRYRSGGLSDIKTFDLKDGLAWKAGTRTRRITDLDKLIGKRGQAGKTIPPGYPSGRTFD